MKNHCMHWIAEIISEDTSEEISKRVSEEKISKSLEPFLTESMVDWEFIEGISETIPDRFSQTINKRLS